MAKSFRKYWEYLAKKHYKKPFNQLTKQQKQSLMHLEERWEDLMSHAREQAEEARLARGEEKPWRRR